MAVEVRARPVAVRELIRHQGRSLAWVAGHLGLSPSAFGNYLAGLRPLPPETVGRLEALLGVPLDRQPGVEL